MEGPESRETMFWRTKMEEEAQSSSVDFKKLECVLQMKNLCGGVKRSNEGENQCSSNKKLIQNQTPTISAGKCRNM